MFKNLAFILLALLAVGCHDDTKPKPKGELRLEYPQPKYQTFNSGCAYTFEYSNFAQIHDAKKPCWYNLTYPKMKANVFITYFPVKNDFNLHVKEVEKMVYEHTIKATKVLEYIEVHQK